MSIAFQMQSSWRAIVLLWKQLGATGAFAVVIDLLYRQGRGEPWNGQGRPEDTKEKLSRKQCGPAVVLYRTLASRLGNERALELTGRIVLDASILFLKSIVPIMEPEALRAMSEDARRQYIMKIADRFFNADTDKIELTDDAFRYKICRCRFPELMDAVGHPELAPLFCRGDQVFFDEHQPHVEFFRPVTLAQDRQPCDFNFRLKTP